MRGNYNPFRRIFTDWDQDWSYEVATGDGREEFGVDDDISGGIYEIQNQRSQMSTIAEDYVAGLYGKYNASDMDGVPVADLQSACSLSTLAQSGGAGSYAESRAAAAVLGFNSSANISMTIQYRPEVNETTGAVRNDSTTLEGGLFTDWRPAKTNGSFDDGVTYNTRNTSETVIFIAQTVNGSAPDNGTKTYRLDGNFTVGEITDVTTGETVDKTTPREEVPSSTNTSEHIKTIKKITDYRNQVGDNYEAIGSGGSGGSDGSGSGLLGDGFANFVERLAIGGLAGTTVLAAMGFVLLLVFFRNQ
jgi:hypothetical protein